MRPNFSVGVKRIGSAALLALGAFLMSGGCGGRPDDAGYSEAVWLLRLAKSGFEEGRQGNKIDLIILYTTEHAAQRAKKLWCESESLSGHYMVTQQGEVWQFLRDGDTGWHAGNKEYNLRSIAVAVEGFADPHNPENPTQDTAWQTDKQLDALAKLVKWLCERYAIPVDRAHIIGKNQVPGVRTDANPQSGPEFWGGASNKSSPGATWNWSRLMEKLGRKPEYQSLVVTANGVTTTLPKDTAPVITPVQAGKELTAYDKQDGFWLVLVSDPSVPQPYLPAGRYHYDGWIAERFVTNSPMTGQQAVKK